MQRMKSYSHCVAVCCNQNFSVLGFGRCSGYVCIFEALPLATERTEVWPTKLRYWCSSATSSGSESCTSWLDGTSMF